MTTPFTVRTDDATLEQVRDLAVSERRSISFMAAELIREALDQRGRRHAVTSSTPASPDADMEIRPLSVAETNRRMLERMGAIPPRDQQ